MFETKFYVCKKCGNLVTLLQNGGGKLVCCGEEMSEIKAGVVEASREKHIPLVDVKGDTVHAFVGAAEHPMTAEHLISWLYLETEKGCQIKRIEAGDKPEATFILNGDKPIAVYAYCNLHGLWKTEI